MTKTVRCHLHLGEAGISHYLGWSGCPPWEGAGGVARKGGGLQGVEGVSEGFQTP